MPFNAVKGKKKDNKWWLVMNTTKDALKSAPGYKYDSNKNVSGFPTSRKVLKQPRS